MRRSKRVSTAVADPNDALLQLVWLKPVCVRVRVCVCACVVGEESGGEERGVEKKGGME